MGCGSSTPASAPADDSGLHQAILHDQSGIEVTFHATALNTFRISHGHQRFRVRTDSGDLLEVDHNLELAEQIPLQPGERLLIHGQLYVDPQGAGVHCTHQHTSRGCPQPGFIQLENHTYS